MANGNDYEYQRVGRRQGPYRRPDRNRYDWRYDDEDQRSPGEVHGPRAIESAFTGIETPEGAPPSAGYRDFAEWRTDHLGLHQEDLEEIYDADKAQKYRADDLSAWADKRMRDSVAEGEAQRADARGGFQDIIGEYQSELEGLRGPDNMTRRYEQYVQEQRKVFRNARAALGAERTGALTQLDARISEIRGTNRADKAAALSDIKSGQIQALEGQVSGLQRNANSQIARINADPSLTETEKSQLRLQARLGAGAAMSPAIGQTLSAFSKLEAETRASYDHTLTQAVTSLSAAEAETAARFAQAGVQLDVAEGQFNATALSSWASTEATRNQLIQETLGGLEKAETDMDNAVHLANTGIRQAQQFNDDFQASLLEDRQDPVMIESIIEMGLYDDILDLANMEAGERFMYEGLDLQREAAEVDENMSFFEMLMQGGLTFLDIMT